MDRYRTRKEWGAKAPKELMEEAPRKRDIVFIHHSVTSGKGDEAMQELQEIAFARGFSDVSYTKAVDSDGVRYQGRQTKYVGAHTSGYNASSHAIVAIGNYETGKPTDALLKGIARQIVAMRRSGALTGNCEIAYHQQVSATACPGKFLIAEIPTIKKLVKDIENG